MNIFISLIGLAGIIVAKRFALHGSGMGISSHLLILTIKLVLFSMILGFCIIYSENNIRLILVLSALINFVIFHFLEALITQNKLINQRKNFG